MEIKKKIENVEGEVLILNGDIYSFEISRGDGVNRDFCKNGEVIHRLPFEAFYLSDDSIYLSGSYERTCYIYRDSKLDLFSEGWYLNTLCDKYAIISFKSEDDVVYKVMKFPSQKILEEVEVYNSFLNGKRRMLFYSHEDLLFYYRNDHSFEVCNPKDELLFQYDVTQLDDFFKDSIAFKRSQGDRILTLNCCTVVGNRLLLRTVKGRLVCFDLTTFQELWKIDGFVIELPPSLNYTEQYAHLEVGEFKVDVNRGVLYCYDQHVFWELSIETGETLLLVDHTKNAKASFFNGFSRRFHLIGDNIYFPHPEIYDDTKGIISWPRLIAFNKFTGEIVDQLEFKKKSTRKKRLYSFNGLQFIDGVFYQFASGDCFLIEP